MAGAAGPALAAVGDAGKRRKELPLLKGTI